MSFVQTAEFAKKYKKIFSSEAIRGMKLRLYRNVYNISLYKSYVFIGAAHVLSSLLQFIVSIDLQWEK